MDSPLEQPRNPDDVLQDVHDLGRDIAYGVVQKWWQPKFDYFPHNSIELRAWESGTYTPHDKQHPLFYTKWTANSIPRSYYELIQTFGLAIDLGKGTYTLSPRAFELLNQPFSPPNVFISYRHDESSELRPKIWTENSTV